MDTPKPFFGAHYRVEGGEGSPLRLIAFNFSEEPTSGFSPAFRACYILTCTHTHVHAHAHMYGSTYTHARMYMHTHTHALTHTDATMCTNWLLPCNGVWAGEEAEGCWQRKLDALMLLACSQRSVTLHLRLCVCLCVSVRTCVRALVHVCEKLQRVS